MQFSSFLLSFALVAAVSASVRPPYCQNEGLQYAAYRWNHDSEPDDDTDPGQIITSKMIGPSHIWHNYTGVYLNGEDSTFWKQVNPVDTASLGLNLIGYIYAPYTGAYVFNFTSINDAVWVWFGEYAYSGPTNDNADFYGSLQHYYPTDFEYNMVAGEYYAFRLIFLNTYGAGNYNLTITTPHAGTMLSTDQLVYFGCNGTAPIFPEYNQTTTTSTS